MNQSIEFNKSQNQSDKKFSMEGWDKDPVRKGEALINHIRNYDRSKKDGKSPITTGQVRKVLAAINIIRNEIKVEDANQIITENKQLLPIIDDKVVLRIKYLEARLAYQAGRLGKEDLFLREEFFKHLMAAVKQIGDDRDKFEHFAMMMESIVAYHKFYEGKD